MERGRRLVGVATECEDLGEVGVGVRSVVELVGGLGERDRGAGELSRARPSQWTPTGYLPSTTARSGRTRCRSWVERLSSRRFAMRPAHVQSPYRICKVPAVTVPPSTSRWDWRCGLARLRRVQAKRLAQIDSAARTILHQARHVGPTWDWRRGLARLRRFEAKRLASIGSARTILHKAQSWPGLISHNQRRIRRYLYWHPDLIWAFICVATSFALAILITAA